MFGGDLDLNRNWTLCTRSRALPGALARQRESAIDPGGLRARRLITLSGWR
jgi:hypothetical protein